MKQGLSRDILFCLIFFFPFQGTPAYIWEDNQVRIKIAEEEEKRPNVLQSILVGFKHEIYIYFKVTIWDENIDVWA